MLIFEKIIKYVLSTNCDPRNLLGNVHKKVNRIWFLEKKVCNYCDQNQKI